MLLTAFDCSILDIFYRWDRNRDGHLSIHEVEKALAAGVATDGISGGAGEDMVNGGGVGNEVQQRTRAEVLYRSTSL